VSDFEDPKKLSTYGLWMATSDNWEGAGSTAAIAPVAGGANGSAGALRVSGEVKPGARFVWAGAMLALGTPGGEAANLSAKREVSFWARGDSQPYAVSVMTESRSGQMPVFKLVTFAPGWTQHSFPLSAFETDGSDVVGLAIARTQAAGKFQFDLDQVEIK